MSKKSRKDPVQVRGRRRDALKVAGVLLATIVTLLIVASEPDTPGEGFFSIRSLFYLLFLLPCALAYFLMAMWNWSAMDYTYGRKDTSPETTDHNLDDVEIDGVNDGDSEH